VAEKLPRLSLDAVKKDLKARQITAKGIYLAHDSMGHARYGGRGDIFPRLTSHFKTYSVELQFYSFYIVESKLHEREIETLVIRAAGPQLHFNTRKKRADAEPGNVRDFEAGTDFYERQWLKGRPKRREKRA
jgi:hypothetical protein